MFRHVYLISSIFSWVYNNSNICVLCVTLQKCGFWKLQNKHTYIWAPKKMYLYSWDWILCIMYLFIKSQWLSHSWIYVTLQQNKHCYKVHYWLANVKYKYNHILIFHKLKKHTKDDLIASFVYNPVQRLIPCDSGINTIDCSTMRASQLLLSEIGYNIGRQ